MGQGTKNMAETLYRRFWDELTRYEEAEETLAQTLQVGAD